MPQSSQQYHSLLIFCHNYAVWADLWGWDSFTDYDTSWSFNNSLPRRAASVCREMWKRFVKIIKTTTLRLQKKCHDKERHFFNYHGKVQSRHVDINQVFIVCLNNLTVMNSDGFGVLHHHDFICCNDLRSALIFISRHTDRLQITTIPVSFRFPVWSTDWEASV